MTTVKTGISWLPVLRAGVWAVLLILNLRFSAASGQNTAFTYQGALNSGGNPATGLYDLRFTVYDSINSTGAPVAGPITNTATPVSNGLFCATFDFGSNVFTGPYRCLEVEVRPNGSTAFTALTPRQRVTPTPYAMTAGNLSGSIPASQISGALSAGQLPPAFITNNASNATITGSFSGAFNGAFYGDGGGAHESRLCKIVFIHQRFLRVQSKPRREPERDVRGDEYCGRHRSRRQFPGSREWIHISQRL